jgi:heme exporter protein C
MIETTAAPFPTIRVRPWLGRLAIAGSLIATFMALVWAPTDAVQGDVYRIIYVHVPLAWLAYLAFFVVFLASLGWLWTKRPWFDALAVASAEVGVLFTGMFILAGSIWAKPTWGVWWTWDPRLTTTAILLLIYLGYLAVRRLPDEPARRASWAAVVGIVGFVDVPIVHLSVTWWRSLHQPATVLRPGAPEMDPQMLVALLLGVAAFTVLFAYLLLLRLRVHRAEDSVVARIVADRMFVPIHEPADDLEVVGDA